MEPQTQEDLNVYTAMMSIFFHAAELCLTEVEQAYTKQYNDSREYQIMQKKYGKIKAAEMLKGVVNSALRNNDKYRLGKLIGVLRRAEAELQNHTAFSMNCFSSNSKEYIKTFDMLQADAKFVCRLYALIGNVPISNVIKVESAIKLLAKENYVSDRVLNSFAPAK